MQSAAVAFPLGLDSRPVRTPVWRLVIEGRDVTREISPMVRSVTYTDHIHGESDELELEVEDRLGRWREAWYPTEGDRVELMLGYVGEPLLPAGAFRIDTFRASGPSDIMTIRALATGPLSGLRTRRSVAYEKQTLRQVAEVVAARHALQVLGTIRPIHVERATQSQEHDLEFLTRLAEAYGYVFSIRDTRMIFYELDSLDASAPTWTLGRTAVAEYSLESATHATYREVQVSYHDPAHKELITKSATDETVKTGDTYKMSIRAEDAGQADATAKAKLRRLNAKRTRGSIGIEGTPLAVAGSNGRLSGWGKFDGLYQVESSVHRMSRRDGYTTSLELVGLG